MPDPVRGRDLHIHRRRARLSQKQLADLIGVHHSLISAAETESIAEFVSPDFARRYVEACEQTAGAA